MENLTIAGAPSLERRLVLRAGAALAAAGPMVLRTAGVNAQTQPDRAAAMFAYVGAFTTPDRKGHGGGINVYRVDRASGDWAHEQLLETVNPSFLILDRDQRILYSVHADLDEVSAYTVDKQTGHIKPLNRQSCGGKNPAHLAIDPTGRWLITANYGAGTIGVLPIERDGALGARSDLVTLPGDIGPHRKEQASSHPHQIVFDPSGRVFAVPDKGLDRIFLFRLDPATGKLAPNDPASVATRSGAGPRHLAFHPTLPAAFVINELESSVTTYRFDSQRGSLEPVQTIPSIPASHTGDNTGAEIAVASSGRSVYASNRGHDSIAVFEVDRQTGALTSVAWTPTGAKSPRFFGLGATGQVLFAANADEGMGGRDQQTTDTVVAFKIDSTTGKLAPTGQVTKVNSPTTIVFAGA